MTILNLRSLKIGVLMNKSSGSCDEDSEEKLAAILRQAGIEPSFSRCVEGSQLDQTLNEITAKDLGLLIVLGGDGTIRAAAERCGARGIMLLPLPGGTMNMLPRALYGKCDWPAALSKTLDQPRALEVSGGEVENHRFFCAGIFGGPSLWSKAREAVRENKFVAAFHHAMQAYHKTFSRNLTYQFGEGRAIPATAVTMICPLISTALSSDQPALEAAALDVETARAAFSLAANAIFSGWRADANVSSSPVTRVHVRSRAPIPAILDGEMVQLHKKAEIVFIHHGFTALVPATG